ncbi:hypothetical protein SUDANB176_00247 [Streptomyces sp. enrichment culture]
MGRTSLGAIRARTTHAVTTPRSRPTWSRNRPTAREPLNAADRPAAPGHRDIGTSGQRRQGACLQDRINRDDRLHDTGSLLESVGMHGRRAPGHSCPHHGRPKVYSLRPWRERHAGLSPYRQQPGWGHSLARYAHGKNWCCPVCGDERSLWVGLGGLVRCWCPARDPESGTAAQLRTGWTVVDPRVPCRSRSGRHPVCPTRGSRKRREEADGAAASRSAAADAAAGSSAGSGSMSRHPSRGRAGAHGRGRLDGPWSSILS